ncbi:MAG: class I SAM-dependent methyltransferase [Lachnospiraceae bacterium]
MKCKICSADKIETIYKGTIRNGGIGKFTEEEIPVYQCSCCKVIWHENLLESSEYYESTEYRDSLEGSSREEDFYQRHDKESLDKFLYTGTERFRNKIVADIGCGCGAFLDLVSGAASEVIAVEPSAAYRKIMDRKGFHTFAYGKQAAEVFGNRAGTVVSFDVIEHVEDPRQFLMEIYDLLEAKGTAVIGTPTDAPIMRELLGETYEKQILYSTQHLWIFSEQSLKQLCQESGFHKVEIKFFQRYGIENVFSWMIAKEPQAAVVSSIFTDTLNQAWRGQCSDLGLADYMVVYLEK